MLKNILDFENKNRYNSCKSKKRTKRMRVFLTFDEGEKYGFPCEVPEKFVVRYGGRDYSIDPASLDWVKNICGFVPSTVRHWCIAD